MKFHTAYSPAPSVSEPSCPKEITDYIKNATTGELEPCGTIPVYERIQSYHESTKLSTKLKRFAMGDVAALGVPRDCDVDLVGIPTNLQDVLNARKKVENDFNSLPGDVRAIFENDFQRFYAAVNDGTAESKLGKYFSSLAKGNGTGNGGASSESSGSSNTKTEGGNS